ncbi:zinc ribbon-containing protein [Heliorestis convoluta]|uniref:Rubredoxin n=1 Tax=Heliorestis convoluta TaxID=356322 RepID=A0A5Q2MW34_9FIRM|nr:hypothetical protein [Heliorestis convoluta]QGG46478.1 hypothetical protein FTV88_0299 [Heliorestis convoluta]
MMPKAGEKPGKGSYKCEKCRYVAELQDNEELPVCPICKYTGYVKLS